MEVRAVVGCDVPAIITSPVPDFQWRSRDGSLSFPSDMHSKHLFYTWLMIWNHLAPEHARVWFNHHYRFNEFYTGRYMLMAFEQLYVELKGRTDLGPHMLEVIQQIEDFVLTKRIGTSG